MQIPNNEKSSLNLMQGFITFQIYLNTTKSFTIEIAISDTNNGKKRILLSACSKEFIINQLHCRIPIINIPTGIWINLSVDILSFVSECFKSQSFRAIDSICLSADCKIRRICGMRQLYTVSEEDYLQGNDNVLPKGFILPNEINHININFDMNYINQTVDIKNIKNNTKDKKTYPKTSQSKREGKITNGLNQVNDNQKISMGNKVIRNDKRSKSINKPKFKNNLENEFYKNKNNCNLKEFVELNNKGSNKNIKNHNGLNKMENHKKDQKDKDKLIRTTKREENYKSNYLTKKKSIEKINSKSLGKVYTKSNTNTFIKGKKNNIINNIKNENTFKRMHSKKEEKIVVIPKVNNANARNIQNENKNNNIKTTVLNNNNEYNKQSQIIQKNKVIFNNNNYNIIIPKEELNLLNTFNYKELESKENTLVINQSNFNNASIPEIVDLDTNNTYLKNIENETNFNNDIIMIDKNKNERNSYINHEQIDSIIAEKLLSSFNDNKTESENERPYTPPLQKIIPINNENTSLNNVNISKINESLIQNHYYDLVYDHETGRIFDKKTKIFYDFK
jgi:hypothetical protein